MLREVVSFDCNRSAHIFQLPSSQILRLGLIAIGITRVVLWAAYGRGFQAVAAEADLATELADILEVLEALAATRDISQ